MAKRKHPPTVRRKNVRIDQEKLRHAMEILGVDTETEAIDRALDMVTFRDELIEATAALYSPADDFEDMFNEPMVFLDEAADLDSDGG